MESVIIIITAELPVSANAGSLANYVALRRVVLQVLASVIASRLSTLDQVQKC